MTVFTEVVDAAADATTIYSLKMGDRLYGSNSSEDDRDWISVYLEPGYTYRFGIKFSTNHLDKFFRLFDSEGNYLSGVTFYPNPAFLTVTEEGTYFIEVRNTFDVQQAQKLDHYQVWMTELWGKRWYGTNGRDELTGGSGHDEMFGYKGKDTLVGLDSYDWLKGGKGKDRLEGGEGEDKLEGGSGADVFVYRDASESITAGRGRDYIRDFSQADGDRINLKHIDARIGTAKDDAFKFIGAAAFSGAEGELRNDNSSGGTYIYADVDGDRKVDLEIYLVGKIDLEVADFVL